MTAAYLWNKEFTGPEREAPWVFWSDKIGRRTLVHAKCFDWGIVVSRPQYCRVRELSRERWVERVLKHELLHWAGYLKHDARFKRAAKELGTW